MKLLPKLLLFFFFSLNILAQEKGLDSIVIAILDKKPKNYFRLQEKLDKVKFSKTQVQELTEVSKKNKYVLGEIYAYNYLGKIYRNESKYDEAIIEHKKALFRAEEYKLLKAQIVTLNKLGVVYRRQDKIRQAIDFHQDAYSLIIDLEEKKDPDVKDLTISKSITNNSIGNIYITIKQFQLALDKFEEAIKIQKELNDLRGLAINHHNIGAAYKEMGDLNIALENFLISLSYNLKNNDNLGKIICHISISEILLKQGKYNDAYEYISDIVKLAEERRNWDHLINVYNTLGSILTQLNKLPEAKVYLDKAILIGEEYEFSSSLAQTYFYLRDYYIKSNNYKQAYLSYEKATKIEEENFKSTNKKYITSLITTYDLELKNNKIKALEKERENDRLKLTRNRNILLITLVSLALFSVILYSVYRQRLLNNDKRVLKLEQEALQSQMNPHFVFNALNSIKLYIINNEQKNAVYYLNKFSKLIRNILEASKIKEVSLAEELKTMNLYMSIENIRFSNEIEYEEIINDNINLDRIKIPPLVLQPFLENAIWHGLSSKKGSKKISLVVDIISEDFIKISIEDNGIGRDAAMKIKQGKSLNRKSIGIDLTKKRLNNYYNKEYKSEYTMWYVDLFDKQDTPSGTRVILKIPLT